MTSPSHHIQAVRTDADLGATRSLFEDYAATLGIDLCFQGFAEELALLPGKYAPPTGEILLARDDAGQALGCVALRALPEDGSCEMKRLYVAPPGRGSGLGRALAEAIIAQARRVGYREMRLDTLPSMAAAVGLYQALGFREIGPYYNTPIVGTIFLAKPLVTG